MKQLSIAGLEVCLTGGSDREGGGDGPAVVLLHGFGAPGTDLVPLWRELRVPPGTRFIFPAAPLSLDIGLPAGFGDARAWWMIDTARLEAALAKGEFRDLSRDVPEGLADARERVDALLSALETDHAVHGERLVLGGFSQGAMLSLDVALRTSRALAGLVLLSGTLLARDEWTSLMPARRGLPVLMSHGRADPLLPYALSEELARLLGDAGLDVQFEGFNGAHEIGGGVRDELARFIEARFSPE